MENRGWIKIHRQIWNNDDIWNDGEPFDRRSAWVDLLLMANHEPRDILVKGQLIHLERGQMLTSIVHLSERWHRSRGWVLRYIKILENLKMISFYGTALGTTLTIEKYDFFQIGRTAYDTADGTALGTTDDTADGTADGTQTRNIKNYKNYKNVKENNSAADDGAVLDPSKGHGGIPWQ